MRLLSRYVCAYFLRYFCLGLLGCTGLFLIVELFDRMDDFIERQVFWVDAVHYLFLKLPKACLSDRASDLFIGVGADV